MSVTIVEALAKINRAFSLLAFETRAENLTGQFSKNRLTEDLLLPVFRLAFDAPGLRNVNRDRANYPNVDLVDDGMRIAIQVTTERKAAKITSTLEGFIADQDYKRYDRLVFFILTNHPVAFNETTRAQWKKICGRKLKFNLASDIVSTEQLYALIQRLPEVSIYAAEKILSRSVVGEASIDVESVLRKQTRQQVDYEKKSNKYIPDIFIETLKTKDYARYFAHPTLFFQRTLDSINRLSLPALNRVLVKAGLPAVAIPDLRPAYTKKTMAEVTAAAVTLTTELTELYTLLKRYEVVSEKNLPPFPVKKEREHYFKANTYTLHSYGWSLGHDLEEILNNLRVIRARIFIFTGKAGQGKTNFVCDFVESFLARHEIVCGYLSGRRLSLLTTNDLAESVQRMLFEGKTTSFADAAQRLAAVAERLDRPFVLIIDGLNEHHKIAEFSAQLETFMETTLQYPNLRLLLTCRSEFYQDRFGNLAKASFADETFLYEANERRPDEERWNRLVAGYFSFFKLNPKLVSDSAVAALKTDVLLLRFFCEAYGARGKPTEYKQPNIPNLYREQIFKIYIDNKLGSADAFLRRLTGKTYVQDSKTEMHAVLEHAVRYMLTHWHFSDVPLSAIPVQFHDALYVLLDEQIVLRRDIALAPSIFSPAAETLNFTFDEFRDFLIAQYLLYRVFFTDRQAFLAHIARNDPKDSQIVEGIKKFLFYASRHPEHNDFWKFYRGQPWYTDVYYTEVFNIEDKLTNADDRDRIWQALQSGGERALAIVSRLAIRWHPEVHTILNLNLLLSFIAQVDDDSYEALIGGHLCTYRHAPERLSAETLCTFIDKWLPEHTPNLGSPETTLFRFVIALLPVDGGADLENYCVRMVRKLLAKDSKLLIGLLKESLDYKMNRHRPYVWRLLTEVSTWIAKEHRLLVLAQADAERSIISDTVLNQEASRFAKRFVSQ